MSEAALNIIDQTIKALENFYGSVCPKRDGYIRLAASEVDELIFAERETNCKAVCPDCANGYPIGADGRHVIEDSLTGIPCRWDCRASPIRAFLNGESK